jgi:hypothetical protein
MQRWVEVGVVLLLGLGGLAVGCGGSSPVEENLDDMTRVDTHVSLDVNVQVSRTRVQPGEIVDISATVTAVRAEAVRFSWVNVTRHGQLLGDSTGVLTGPVQIRWESPASLEPGAVKVEVIQLVVTAISQIIAVNDRGVQTSHDIATETRTIPLTITSAP